MNLFDLYQDIKARLTEKVPALKKITLYNSQLESSSAFAKQNTTVYPRVYIEWEPMTFRKRSGGIQDAQVEMKVHVVTKCTVEDDRAPYDLAEAVLIALSGYRTERFTALERTEEVVDVDHAAVYDYMLRFRTTYTDDRTFEDRDVIEVPVQLQVETDLIIDHPVVRTGRWVKIEEE